MEPAAKSNSRRIVKFGNKIRIIKSKKALEYKNKFDIYVPPGMEPFEGDVGVAIKTWYRTRRPDLSIELILDVMQGKLYKNDRQVKEQHAWWALDKENPRSNIFVWSLNV